MNYFNCDKSFIKTVYNDRICIKDENYTLEKHNTKVEGQISVCYLGCKEKEDSTQYTILEMIPCDNGHIRTLVDEWEQVGKRYYFLRSRRLKSLRGDEETAQNICQHIADNNLEGEDAIQYVCSVLQQQESQKS